MADVAFWYRLRLERRIKMGTMGSTAGQQRKDVTYASSIFDILGESNISPGIINSRMDLIELSRKGINKDSLIHLAKYLSLSINQMADFLSITERTIQRYSRSKMFSSFDSERILQIAEVALKGTQTLGDRESFITWMKHPNKAFRNRTPLSLIDNSYGREMILEELGRIEHGIFS
jgi:putative toxin-antitoxin system antitoxin component (TIGR02293 family)